MKNEYWTDILVYMQKVFRVSLCFSGTRNHKISAGSEETSEVKNISELLPDIIDIDMTGIVNV